MSEFGPEVVRLLGEMEQREFMANFEKRPAEEFLARLDKDGRELAEGAMEVLDKHRVTQKDQSAIHSLTSTASTRMDNDVATLQISVANLANEVWVFKTMGFSYNAIDCLELAYREAKERLEDARDGRLRPHRDEDPPGSEAGRHW